MTAAASANGMIDSRLSLLCMESKLRAAQAQGCGLPAVPAMYLPPLAKYHKVKD
jgi:hypothetical protein